MTYKEIVRSLQYVFDKLPDGVDLAKGGIGELALANHLDHYLVPGDKGPDAHDGEGHNYEYKVSTTNQFNFHFGSRTTEFAKQVQNHFEDIEGAFCAIRKGMRIIDCEYVPSTILVPHLIKHFNDTDGKQLNKNFSMKAFRKLMGEI